VSKTPEEIVADIHDAGYREGYDEGYREGRNDGYQEGIDDGEHNAEIDDKKTKNLLARLRAELNYVELKFAGASDEKVLGYIDGFRDAMQVLKEGR
jgi:flagellar biosynthesis/type III secretory pathway protein FliH